MREKDKLDSKGSEKKTPTLRYNDRACYRTLRRTVEVIYMS